MKKFLSVMAGLMLAVNAFAVAPVTNDLAVGTGFAASDLYRMVVTSVKVDCVANPANTGDVFYVMNVPAKTYVQQVFLDVTTENTNATATLGIGDASSATRYLAAQTITTQRTAGSAYTAAITQAITTTNLIYVGTAGSLALTYTNAIDEAGETNLVVNGGTYTAGTIKTNTVVATTAAATSAITPSGYLYDTAGKIAVTFSAPEAVAKFTVTAVMWQAAK